VLNQTIYILFYSTTSLMLFRFLMRVSISF